MVITPVGVKQTRWRPVKTAMTLTCSGGMLGRRDEPVITALHPSTKEMYVKMCQSERWLQRLVTGGVGYQSLHNSSLIDTILSKCHIGGVTVARDDPMNSLAYEGDVSARVPILHLSLNTIIEMDMPEVCPLA